MKEIWDHPFGYALLKIERAEQHIANIHERLLTASKCDSPFLSIDLKTGEKYLQYRCGDYMMRGEIGAIIGDALHNLRSALDICWVSLLGDRAGRWTEFPIDPKGHRNRLIGVLTANAGEDASSPIHRFMVDSVKCYDGGDDDILALHELDVQDKHHGIIATIAITGIKGIELENEDGDIDVFDIVLRRGQAYRERVPFGCQLKNHGEPIFEIKFGEGTRANGWEVFETLRRLTRKVREINRRLHEMGAATHRPPP